MRMRFSGAAAVAVLCLVGVTASGCATKRYVRDNVAVVDGRVTQVDGRVTQVEGTAREALDRATAAHKLAEGKFMYQVVLSDDTVKFPLNRFELSPAGQSSLTAVADRLKSENKNVYVEIQGHTDNAGPAAYNDKLGGDRAEAVRRFLSKQGVALNRMATISYGEESPVAPNTTRDGRAQNRRVVLVVLS